MGNDGVVLGARIYGYIKFQSTFPRGERPGVDFVGYRFFGISIHVPAWGTTFGDMVYTYDRLGFQSTFPRGERQIAAVPAAAIGTISIHVPAWGTTSVSCA